MNWSKIESALSRIVKFTLIPIVFTVFHFSSDWLLWRTYAFFDLVCFVLLFRYNKLHSIGFVFLFIADCIYGLRTEQVSLNFLVSNLSEGFYSIWSILLFAYFLFDSEHAVKSKTWRNPIIFTFLMFLYLNFHYVLNPFYHRENPPPTFFNIVNSTLYGILASTNTTLAVFQSLSSKSLRVVTLYLGYLLLFFADFATRYQTAFYPTEGAPWSDYGWVSGMGLITFSSAMKKEKKDLEFSDLFSVRVFLSLTVVLITLSTILIAIYFNLFKITDAFGISLVLFLFFYSWATSNFISLIVSNQFLLILSLLKAAMLNPSSRFLKLFTSLDEVGIIIKEYLKIKDENEVLTKKNLKQEQLEALAKLSAQVSHDIRSPLAALEMISGSLNELPEEKRLITRNSINRIRDIANSLLERNRKSSNISDFSPSRTNMRSVLLSPLLDTMITEKREQFRNHVGVLIDYNQTSETYGLFVNVDPLELKRVISNLINNSVEALPRHEGSVDVQLLQKGEHQVEIRISDNGIGIPASQLSEIGKRGVTFGKEGGSGLGIHHAMNAIHGFGGQFEIESEAGKGTIVRIFLKREPAQSWFVPKIKLKKDQTIVVFDDDSSIHQIWTDRLDDHQANNNLKIIHFSTPAELRLYHQSKSSVGVPPLYLMDYEIIGASETGLDLIESLGIHKNAILVTSRYEEELVRERCKKRGIKLIPKAMSGFVPIGFFQD